MFPLGGAPPFYSAQWCWVESSQHAACHLCPDQIHIFSICVSELQTKRSNSTLYYIKCEIFHTTLCVEMCLNLPDWRIKLLEPIQPPDPLPEFFFLRLKTRRLVPVEVYGLVHCETKLSFWTFIVTFSFLARAKAHDGTAGPHLKTPLSLWATDNYLSFQIFIYME